MVIHEIIHIHQGRNLEFQQKVESHRFDSSLENIFLSRWDIIHYQKLHEHVERLSFFTLWKDWWVESLVLTPEVFWYF